MFRRHRLSLSNTTLIRILTIVVCMGLFLAVGVGCGESTGTFENKEVTTATDGLVTSAARVGEGLDFTESDPDERRTDNVCLDGDREIENESNWVTNSFYTHSLAEVDFHLDATVPGKALNQKPFDNLGSAWVSHYDGQPSPIRIFSVVAKVETVQRYFNRGKNVDSGPLNVCRDGRANLDADGFTEVCGTGYLKSETLGGYVVLTTKLGSLSDSAQDSLEAKFSTGLGPYDVDFKNAMEWVANNDETDDLKFEIEKFGSILSPGSYLGPDGRISPGDVVTYMEDLKKSYEQPVDNDKLKDPTYGSVIDQDFIGYKKEVYEMCGAEEAEEGLECYRDFQHEVRDINENREDLLRDFTSLDWKLNHKDRVHWPGIDQVTQAEYETVRDLIGDCMAQSRDFQDTCEDRMDSKQFDKLCEACQLPKDCREDYLEQRVSELPEAPIHPPDGDYTVVGEESQKAIDDTQTVETADAGKDICFLSKVGGEFASSGEFAEVRHGSQKWKLRVGNNQDVDDGYSTFAEMRCVSRGKFVNDASDPNTFTVKTVYSNSNTGWQPMLSPKSYAGTLMGLWGNMNGKGEGGIFKDQNNTRYINAKSATSTMFRVRGMGWGMDESRNGDYAFARSTTAQTNANNTVELSSIDDTICYLKDVYGEFDGPSEEVWVGSNDGDWVLNVRSSCEKNKGVFGGGDCKAYKKIHAKAACYKYDQQDGS